jgi:hypothetical protein
MAYVGQNKAQNTAARLLVEFAGNEPGLVQAVLALQAQARTNAQHNQALMVKVTVLQALEFRKGMR